MDSPAERLRYLRQKAGYDNAADFARAYGINPVTYRAHEAGGRGLRPDAIERYARLFRVPIGWLLSGEGDSPKDIAPIAPQGPAAGNALSQEVDAGQAFAPVPVPHPTDLKTFLPVLGSARGGNGDEGAFDMNGTVIDRIKAPPALANVKGAYGLYVQGTSMEPRYFEGELVFVHPHRPVRIGDFAVIQFKQRHDGDHVRALIKRVVGKTASVLKVEQYNPAKAYDVPLDQIGAIHRILNGDELW